MSNKRVRRWLPLFVAEIQWDSWGIGVELSFGHWWLREFSVYVHVGPLALGGGIEENREWRYPQESA